MSSKDDGNNNIISFPPISNDDDTIDIALENAKGTLSEGIILGWDKDTFKLYMTCSNMSNADALYLLGISTRHMWNAVETPFDEEL